MNAKILDGKKIAQEILDDLKLQTAKLVKAHKRAPNLAVIIVGDNPSSKIYVTNKRNACKNIGFKSQDYDLPITTSENELLNLITKLNNDPNTDGILVQLPLPPQINVNKVIENINPNKDVDGFHPYNLGRLACNNPTLHPCTPKGVMTLLQKNGITNITGMNAVIIGASNIVGRPLALELLNANCTVTICHIHTKNIATSINSADIVISAAGVPNLVKGNWIKPGAIVIDIGITHLTNGQIVGDVEFAIAKKNASYITPVPGGIGPMTIASLLQNTLECYQNFFKI